ncbi:prepilin peptidase, partial [Pseudomonas edaphica]
MSLLLGEQPWVFVGMALVLGLIVGSFLNVLVWRLPKMLVREW